MRQRAHPSVMPVLQQLGYVEERLIPGQTGRTLWFLLPVGRELLTEFGAGEIQEP